MNHYFKPQRFLFILFTLLFTVSVWGQDDTKYYVYQYVKVHPSMENEYLQLELDVWKKIHQARIEKDILDGWYLYRVISPNGSKTEHNFVLALQYDGAEKLAGHFESFGVDYTGLLTSEEIAFALKTPEIRDQVYEEVWSAIDEIVPISSENSFRFQVFNAMSLKPGVTENEYLEVEQKVWKPMHQMRVAMDKMYGWGLYNMIIPGGTEREYHWATVDYYNRVIDIMADNDPIMVKIHGEKNLEKFTQQTLGARDLLRTEVRELLDFMNDSKSEF